MFDNILFVFLMLYNSMGSLTWKRQICWHGWGGGGVLCSYVTSRRLHDNLLHNATSPTTHSTSFLWIFFSDMQWFGFYFGSVNHVVPEFQRQILWSLGSVIPSCGPLAPRKPPKSVASKGKCLRDCWPDSNLTHWGQVTQICVFTLKLCKTDDANLRF